MKCLKCGEPWTPINNNKKSCREHTVKNGYCAYCPGELSGNCYHEWVHFYTFWLLLGYIKTFLNRSVFSSRPLKSDEYVYL